MDFPKLEIMKHVFGRPTYSGVVGKMNEEYLRHLTTELGNPEEAVHQAQAEFLVAVKDFKQQRKEEAGN